jgi:hypothetical protein
LTLPDEFEFEFVKVICHNVFVFCRELKLEDKTDHLRKDLNAMNTRVDELNKEIKHLNIDQSV